MYAVLFGIACYLAWRFHAGATTLMLTWVILFFDVPLRLWRWTTTAERLALVLALLLPLAAIKLTSVLVAFVVGALTIGAIAVLERRVAERIPPAE